MRLQDYKGMRKYGELVNREGMYNRALKLARKAIKHQDHPVTVMECVGQMQALAHAAACDCYWSEKVHHGYYKEVNNARYIVAKKAQK